MIEVYRTGSMTEAEYIRVFLEIKGVHCVLEPDRGDRIMVKKSMVEKAKRLIEGIRPRYYELFQRFLQDVGESKK